ncbi:MAG: ComEC/Rec2 family competence protein [Clostridiaceae bacterium]
MKKKVAGILASVMIFFTLAPVTKNYTTKVKVPMDPNKLIISYIDVGQGDSELIQFHNKNILIDSGPESSRDILINYLKAAHVTRLDYVIATHPHEDHIGNMAEIIKAFKVGVFYAPDVTANTSAYENMVTSLKIKSLSIKVPSVGDKITIGDAALYFLAPNSTGYEDLNNYSIVTKLKFGNRSFIFMGDAEELSEGEILAKQLDLSADVLKVGHHGSGYSTSYEFLKAAHPKAAIISVGLLNDYGHPKQKILDRLTDFRVDIYRTDIQGNTVAVTDGRSLTFNNVPALKGKSNR